MDQLARFMALPALRMSQLFCGSLFLLLVSLLVPDSFSQSDPNLDRILQKIRAQEDYLGALADLEKLLKKPDPDPRLYFQIGICHNLLRNYSKALEHLQKAREKGISGWELSLGFGIAHFHLNHSGRAREEFEQVLASQPSETTALFHLGRLDLMAGNHAQSERRFRSVLSLDPDHQGAIFSLGNSLVRQGKEKEGREVLEYHRKTGHLRSRLRTLNRMASSPRASAEVFSDLGDTYLELGDRKNAIRAYDRAEELDPGIFLTALGRGKLSFADRDFVGAEKHLGRYLDGKGTSCQAYLFLGLVQKLQKKLDASRAALGRGITLCPEDTMLLATLAELEIGQGNFQETAGVARQIMKIDPSAPAGPFFMAFSRLYQNHLEEAESFALQVLDLDDSNPSHHSLLQTIYQAKGETAKAKFHEAKVEALQNQKTSAD